MIVTMSTRRREKSIAAGEFKAKCLALLDEVDAHGSSIVITKRGRPVARVVPLPRAESALLGSLIYEEDLLTPIEAVWEAND